MDNNNTENHSRAPIWAAVGLLTVFFAAGVAFGFGTSSLLLKRKLQAVINAPASAEAPFLNFQRIETKLVEGLDLTLEEQQAVREEITATLEEYKTRRAQVINNFETLLQQTFERVEKRLEPENREKFRKKEITDLIPWLLRH